MRPGEVRVTLIVEEDDCAYIEHEVGQDVKVTTVSNEFSPFFLMFSQTTSPRRRGRQTHVNRGHDDPAASVDSATASQQSTPVDTRDRRSNLRGL